MSHELIRQEPSGPLRTPGYPLVDVPDIAHIFAGQLAASSIAMYKRDTEAYLTFAEAHALNWCDPQTLVSWRDALALQSDKSPNTINRMLSAVKRILREMAIRHLIAEPLALRFDHVRGVRTKALKGRLKKHARTRISPQEMRRLCDAPDKSSLIGLRDAALLAVLATSGLRAGEAASLTLAQVHKREGGYALLVCGKTDIEPREASLSAEAYICILEWLHKRPIDSAYIFTSFRTRGALPTDRPLSEVAVWRIVQQYAEQCGLEHIKPHDFRRFVGTQLASKDIRMAQLALGHKSIDVTARYYVLDRLPVGLTDHLY